MNDKLPSFAGEGDRADEARRLRCRILGVMIRQSRLQAGRSLEDCAEHMSLPAAAFEAWEYGGDPPDHPQLERLAAFLEIAPGDLLRELDEIRPGERADALAPSDPDGDPLPVDLPEALGPLADDPQTHSLLKLLAAFKQIPSAELQRIAKALLALSASKSDDNGL